MSRVAVFVTGTLPAEAKQVLSEFELFENVAKDEELARCQALLCWQSRATPKVLRKMKELKMVQTFSAGVDDLHFESLPPNVQVFSNAGAYTEAVAEHAWGLLLGVAKGLHARNQKTTPRALGRRTLLVVGCGAIGSEVARLSRSLSMKTIGVSRSFKVPEVFDVRLPIAKLAHAMRTADAVVVTLPLTKLTRKIIDYDLLMKTKATAILVNVGRGDTISEKGVVRWLGRRPESRFATDVYWRKGGKESFVTRAWNLPNFAGTLHISGLPLGEDLVRPKIAAALNVRRFFDGDGPTNRVDISEYIEKRSLTPIALNTRRGGRAEQGHRNAKKEIRHKRIRGTQGH